MNEEILWCEDAHCDKRANFLIFPDAGHPSDQGAACDEHLGHLIWAVSSTPDLVSRWEVKPLE